MKTVVTTLNAKYIHMNLTIRYLKAYAEPEFEVEMVEYTIKEPIISIVTDLYKRNPDVIGFSCYIWNIEETLKIIDNLKKIKPDLKVILGGPEVCYEPIHFLEKNKGIDVIVMGEGEGPFKELLHCYSKGDSIENVKGIAYRIGDKIKINPQAPYIDLKTIPSPFRFEEDRKDLANRIIYIEGSRGCPFQCSFCTIINVQGRKSRYRTADDKFVLFCCIEPAFWKNFCTLAGREDLIGDSSPGPVDFAVTDDPEQTLRREIQSIIETRTQAEWTRLAAEHDLAIGPAVQQDELRTDPKLAARGAFVDAVHPVAGPFTRVTLPALVDGRRSTEIRHHAPALGEQTLDILAELWLSPDEVASLRQSGVIGSPEA